MLLVLSHILRTSVLLHDQSNVALFIIQWLHMFLLLLFRDPSIATVPIQSVCMCPAFNPPFCIACALCLPTQNLFFFKCSHCESCVPNQSSFARDCLLLVFGDVLLVARA